MFPQPRGFVAEAAGGPADHLNRRRERVGDGREVWGWVAATGVLWGLSYIFWRRRVAGEAGVDAK
jgi:hypothetical protein